MSKLRVGIPPNVRIWLLVFFPGRWRSRLLYPFTHLLIYPSTHSLLIFHRYDAEHLGGFGVGGVLETVFFVGRDQDDVADGNWCIAVFPDQINISLHNDHLMFEGVIVEGGAAAGSYLELSQRERRGVILRAEQNPDADILRAFHYHRRRGNIFDFFYKH